MQHLAHHPVAACDYSQKAPHREQNVVLHRPIRRLGFLVGHRSFTLPASYFARPNRSDDCRRRQGDTFQLQFEVLERSLMSVRLEIMKLRAEADFIEGTISEENHLIQALKPEDETASERNGGVNKA